MIFIPEESPGGIPAPRTARRAVRTAPGGGKSRPRLRAKRAGSASADFSPLPARLRTARRAVRGSRREVYFPYLFYYHC